MNYYDFKITFNEIPQEISIVFSITGCGGKCFGCHSEFLHDRDNGNKLELDMYKSILSDNQSLATTVLFLGGEWEVDLIEYLKIAKKFGYKTALYTSSNYRDITFRLKYSLDYLKVGKYIDGLGGLESVLTNQKLIRLKPKRKDVTHLFWPQSKPK
ncbi:4Fe-4S cluster-binding domain-containing protein [Mycoplasmatota bacterium]|nr:4Fe-4S cluster-binding domain-containing protein [Mycoplasmatota bacterium]